LVAQIGSKSLVQTGWGNAKEADMNCYIPSVSSDKFMSTNHRSVKVTHVRTATYLLLGLIHTHAKDIH